MGASKKESVEVDKKEEEKKNRKKTQRTKKEKLSTEESLLHLKQEDTATDYKVFSEDDASEDYKSVEKSEAGDSESSGDEGFHNTGSNEGLANEGQSEDSEPDQGGEESDSSEDEVAPRNTVGDVPLEWYRDEKHIGYDIAGKKLKKKERQDKLDSFLANVDNSKNWRKIYDEYNDEDVELTKEETKLIRRMLKGKAPHGDFDLYAPYVDWFKWEDSKHPLSNAPEPKSRFIPSKWEAKKVLGLVRAIRKGLIKFDKPKEEPRFYMLWGDDASSSEKTGHLSYIPAPKPNLPGHEESYNPSLEYIPTQEEINSYQLMDEEDRPKFIPKRFMSLRSIPAYENVVKDSFERCLDLYLCPRVRKKRINIDPESLKPKLPGRKDLKPYPATCYLEYKGHKGAVMSISTETSGHWIASGSSDGTVRLWEVETCRCIKVWEFGEVVQYVAWNPLPELPILAVSVGQDVFLLNTGLGNEETQRKVKELLHVATSTVLDDSGNKVSAWSWLQDDKHEGIRLRHFKTVYSVEWHRKGDYFSTLSKKFTQRHPFKLHGLPVSAVFHPTRSIFFVSTKKNVRVYDLLKQKLIKKLENGLRDNVIVGSRDGKLCWFDMDLSSKPYKVLKCHPKDITNVAFHRSYPLFASCSDDCTAYVFHGMVYSDLNQNPLIVPLEILRGHASSNGRGVLDCKFHPRQPWLFTAGADSLIKLYCH
ncbi:RIBOSOME BIOGENESIS PROTEIN BOP1 BLOCK OF PROLIFERATION 1 PROTEIN [Salix viminalis]|uniref:Ribosome biogenesis protein BOP1 homolog n=1 Tax=Salix viminalis TaxID=40686 RepID=A0A9Q0QDC8_SALVM|nr:RIBOSOME BIOGENESIS PROTEIN BOP1 BLOCK OF PROLIFERATION 1 PROTEIN [Salix viminalis]